MSTDKRKDMARIHEELTDIQHRLFRKFDKSLQALEPLVIRDAQGTHDVEVLAHELAAADVVRLRVSPPDNPALKKEVVDAFEIAVVKNVRAMLDEGATTARGAKLVLVNTGDDNVHAYWLGYTPRHVILPGTNYMEYHRLKQEAEKLNEHIQINPLAGPFLTHKLFFNHPTPETQPTSYIGRLASSFLATLGYTAPADPTRPPEDSLPSSAPAYIM